MDADGLEKLQRYLDRVTGGSCTLPFEGIRDLIGLELPEAAASETWWTDSAGWPAWPASNACRSAGWRVESVHAAARLVRLARDRKRSDAHADGRVVGSSPTAR